MNRFLEKIVIWIDKNPIAFLIIAMEVVIVFYIILQIKEKNRARKIDKVVKFNAKMKNLDRRLTNPRWLEKENRRSERYHPYESEFHDLTDIREDSLDTRVNLEVNAPFIHEKYLVYVGDGVTLGSSNECEVIVADHDVASRHCQIVQDKKGILLKRLDGNHATILERGRKFFKLADKEVRLQAEDRISMGGSQVKIGSIQKG